MPGTEAVANDASPGEDALVVFRAVTFRYPSAETPALDGLDLAIPRGAFVGLIGATGAGKSTFCRALNGIVPQFYGGRFSGAVTVAGHDTVDVETSRLAAHVGMVLDDPQTQLTATTVEAECAFALENRCVPSEEIRRRVTVALAAVGLEGQELKHPANLSGGQQQRLAIASAIALVPDIIVLDEPTSQLDPIATEDVFAILKRLNREDGITVIVASSASEELAEVADRILLLSEGRLVEDGPPAEILARIRTLVDHHVRPPDITQTVDVMARRWPAAAPAALPVTLDAALAVTGPFAAHLRDLPPAVQRVERPRDGAAALSVHGLTHVYPDGTKALDGVDLTVLEGSFTGIAGRNGSGKSTLVKHFLKLLDPTAGTVRAGGEDVAGFTVSRLARRIGYVAQNAHQQIFCDRVRDEVAFALTMQKRPKAEVDQAVARALDDVALTELADRHPMSLSRGDRLRVVIAAVLALDPQTLIFDEPTTGQDWRGALAILDILKRLNARGRTVVLITHHLYLLPDHAERLVVMGGGRVLLDGPLRDVFYDRETLERAGIAPPQTVRFARESEALMAQRPLGPADLARTLARCEGRAA